MKKLFLSIAASLLVSSGLFANTAVSLTSNAANSSLDDFSGSNTSAIPASYTTPKAGDIITLTVKGTATYNITQLQAVILGNGSGYVALSGYTDLGIVTAGSAFSFTTDILLTADAGTDGIKLGLDAKSQAAVDAKATSVDFDLSELSMTVTPFVPGVTTLTASGTVFQGIYQDTIPATTVLKTGDIVRFTVGGTYVSEASATDFQVYIVNNTADAKPIWWQPLSANSVLAAGPIVNGQKFSYTVDNVITADQAGTAVAASHKIVLIATSTANVKIQYLTIKAAIGVSGVALDQPTAAITTPAGTVQLAATVAPSYASDQSVSYSVSDASLAIVSATGLVTAKANGTVTVTVTTTDGSKTATSVIAISGQPSTTVAVTSVSFDKTTAAISTKGGTVQLTATVAPTAATIQAVTYTVSDANLATVSTTGLVTAKANGTVTVTATSTDGSFTATSVVTITNQETAASLVEGSKLRQIGNVFTFEGTAKLINVIGQVVATATNTLDASSVAPGIYFIVIDGKAKEVLVK